ncbi:histone-like nucleoid-structuring protein Lsr2 [Kitasatospora sp. NPDC001660]
MAQKMILTDDLDTEVEGDGVENVEITYKGITWELDLGEANRAVLDAALAPFLAVARRKAANRPAAKRRSTKDDPEENRRIREWAVTAGLTLPSRGPVPKEIRAQYEQRESRIPEQTGVDA